MVVERRNFQRVYDLTHRVMPHWDDTRDLLPQADAEFRMLENSARAVWGCFVLSGWRITIACVNPPYLYCWSVYRPRKRSTRSMLRTLARHGCMLHCCHCWSRPRPINCGPRTARCFRRLTRWCGIANVQNSCLISAIDWSAIPPAPKRQFGYFVLPLLHRGRLVGRMDAKMHRKEGVLEIIALYLEAGVKPGDALEKGLQAAITDFARWQGAQRGHLFSSAGRAVLALRAGLGNRRGVRIEYVNPLIVGASGGKMDHRLHLKSSPARFVTANFTTPGISRS